MRHRQVRAVRAARGAWRWTRLRRTSGRQRFPLPGRVFNSEEFAALKASTTPLRFPVPDGSVFIGDKGMLTTGTYGEMTRLIPVEKMQDYRMPPRY